MTLDEALIALSEQCTAPDVCQLEPGHYACARHTQAHTIVTAAMQADGVFDENHQED